MPKKRSKNNKLKPSPTKKRKKSKSYKRGTIYQRVVVAGKTVKLKSPQGARAKQLKKINYKKAAAKIRRFESLPFRNKTNFDAAQKRVITRRWKIVRYYQSIKPGARVSPELKKTNAITSRGQLVLHKKSGFRRILSKWYVLDTIGARREYTIFLSRHDLQTMIGAESPLAELRRIVLSRHPRGFLLRWAKGQISEEEVHYSWVYGAYPAGRISEGSFNRYTIEHLKNEQQRRKITAVRLIYHVGGIENDD